jgi:nicotinamidase-related amidase
MKASDTALLVIDVQESFVHRPYWDPSRAAAFLDRLQALVQGAAEREIATVQVFHVESSGPFSLESGFVKPLMGFSMQADLVVHKTRHSALAGTILPIWLAERGIRRLIVSGIRTEQCCETTTRHASDSGYDVDFVSEATLTFAMRDAKSRVWSPEEIKERTELVLQGRFARVATVEQALASAQALGEIAGRAA